MAFERADAPCREVFKAAEPPPCHSGTPPSGTRYPL